MASWRTRLQLTLAEAWQQRGPLAWLLAPLSLLHYAYYTARRALYAARAIRPARLDVPVIVIGNLYVGGTGKTPLTIALARAVEARGYRPGIVSRGYGGSAQGPRLVAPNDDPREVGDEPLLIARATGVPVAIGSDRVAAAQLLRRLHPECTLLVTDDGLQHLRLAREVEIAVVHHRGLGNGWMLPAGPLREPPRRLASVDIVVCNGTVPGFGSAAPVFEMRSALGPAQPLAGMPTAVPLDTLVDEQRRLHWRIVAAAGIGAPDRFFAMLRAAGLAVDEMPLADHFDFAFNPFASVAADRILITEKDAVKCRANPALADDARLWVVPLTTTIDAALVDAVLARLDAN